MSAWTRLTVVIAVLLLFVGVFQSPPGRSILKKIGLVGDPSSFTAIAFANPKDLPLQLASARTKLNLAFTISNDTSAVADYQWTVTVTTNKKAGTANSGYAQLAPNVTTTIARQIVITCKKGQAEVTVSLKSPDEHIDAIMACR
jgi:hypothetical protein